MQISGLLEKAIAAKRESKHVEFKESFDTNSSRDWCEIIKDIVAIANSGGGVLLFGVKNNGQPSGIDVTEIASTDPADITNKIAKYTGEQFCEFDICTSDKDGKKVAVMLIGSSFIPMVFVKPGTYDIGGGKQQTAFGRGTIYFRHGAKSETLIANDLRDVIEGELKRIRRSWLGDIRKVVEAPSGYRIHVLPAEVVESTAATATPIRITDDPNAPLYRKLDPNLTHPYRLKEVVANVNKKLAGEKVINSHDVMCVRDIFKTDKDPKYYYKVNFASPIYSEDFVNYLVEQFNKDKKFFEKARQAYAKKYYC